MDLSPQTTTTGGLSDKSWLQSTHGVDLNLSVTLDLTKFTANTHYPDGSLRSGLALGIITAASTGGAIVCGPYDDTATDGRQVLAGHLFEDEKVNAGSTKVGAALFRHGGVKTANLPANHGLDAAGKADVKGQILYS